MVHYSAVTEIVDIIVLIISNKTKSLFKSGVAATFNTEPI